MSEIIMLTRRSIGVALDMEPDRLESVVEETHDVEGVSGYKLGFSISLSRMGLPMGVEKIKLIDEAKVVTYDHQKGGTDIPENGKIFAKRMAEASVDAAIIFPLTGPDTEEVWIKELQDKGIGVIVGGEMTHDTFKSSAGGRIDDAQMLGMYEQAAGLGVTNFVVPGVNPERIRFYKSFLADLVDGGDFTMFSLGFGAQGGNLANAAEMAGDNLHAFIGRAIFEAADVRLAAENFTQQLLAA